MTTAQSDAGSVEPAERPRPVEATADAPKLVPTVADVVVRGDGSRATISEFATRHADAMARACREVAEVGRVTVGFSVAEDGTVSEPAVLGGGAMSLDERPLAGCVAQQIHAWRFAEGQASSVVLYLRWADPHKLPERLTPQMAQEVVSNNRQSVARECKPLVESGAQRVEVMITVARSGNVAKVLSDGPNQELNGCVEALVTRWVFPPSQNETALRVPFVFIASGGT